MNALVLGLVLTGLSPAVSGQALRVIASAPVADIEVLTTQAVPVPADFRTGAEPITGVGLTGLFTGIRVDNVDGLGPWSLDVRLRVDGPGGESISWNPIGGDVTIADYPLADGTGGLPGTTGGRGWTFTFDSVETNPAWTYGIEDVTLFLLGSAPEVVESFDAEPDPELQWSRPFFIDGVSGLGPVAYHVRTFSVNESGVYEFESVLDTVDDHFTFLYRGGFDPAEPLTNLLDYGLGNGFSAFGVPRGTSRFSALLLEGETYHWVTSQWDRFGTIIGATNTVTGPGPLVEPCVADVNGDGELTPTDFGAWLSAFNAMDPRADQNADGEITPTDFGAWLANFNAGC